MLFQLSSILVKFELFIYKISIVHFNFNSNRPQAGTILFMLFMFESLAFIYQVLTHLFLCGLKSGASDCITDENMWLQ